MWLISSEENTCDLAEIRKFYNDMLLLNLCFFKFYIALYNKFWLILLIRYVQISIIFKCTNEGSSSVYIVLITISNKNLLEKQD